MHAQFSKYVAATLLVTTGIAVASCSDSSPAEIAGPSAAQLLALTAEPEHVVPEFLSTRACTASRAFRTRFVVIVIAQRSSLVRGMRLSFVDRFGVSVIPTLITSTRMFPGSTLATPTPVSLPSSMPIPIPLSGPNNGLSVPTGGRERFPIELEFGCDVSPRGTIIVEADTRDDRGRSGRSRLRVEVGE